MMAAAWWRPIAKASLTSASLHGVSDAVAQKIQDPDLASLDYTRYEMAGT